MTDAGEQLALQVVEDGMTFSEWFHSLPIGLPDGSQYVHRDENGELHILRRHELEARGLDERLDAKEKRLKRIKQRPRKHRRMTEGEFTPNEATSYLRERLGIQVPPVSEA